jgi:hypothetical protein
MEDDVVEEQGLLLLREQLGAVHNIRRELEKKEQQIQTLKLQLAESHGFREQVSEVLEVDLVLCRCHLDQCVRFSLRRLQAISLRTQCRIFEEQMSILVRDSRSPVVCLHYHVCWE